MQLNILAIKDQTAGSSRFVVPVNNNYGLFSIHFFTFLLSTLYLKLFKTLNDNHFSKNIFRFY